MTTHRKAHPVPLRELLSRAVLDIEHLTAERDVLARRLMDIDLGHTGTPIPFFSCSPAQYMGLWKRLHEAEAAVARLAQTTPAPQPTPPPPVDPWDLLRARWRAEQARWPGSSPRFRGAIRMALTRGKSWSLTPDEYEPLAAAPCDVCGGPTGKGIGLNRLDHRQGYTIDNVRPCCGTCNVRRGRAPWPPHLPRPVTSATL